jgi:hypothetical protein
MPISHSVALWQIGPPKCSLHCFGWTTSNVFGLQKSHDEINFTARAPTVGVRGKFDLVNNQCACIAQWTINRACKFEGG